jgi:U3 small nucleolar RNA-associated protein 10
VILEHLRPLFKVFLDAFDVTKIPSSKGDEVRRARGLSDSPFSSLCHQQAEARAISAFLELVVKLNEAAFRPLFRRLYDWAFAGEAGA